MNIPTLSPLFNSSSSPSNLHPPLSQLHQQSTITKTNNPQLLAGFPRRRRSLLIPGSTGRNPSQHPPNPFRGGGKRERIQRPRSKMAESCTAKCVGTCIRGGAGSPGEGVLNMRRPLVIFKKEFRSRHYCLVECSDICNLIKDGDDGP